MENVSEIYILSVQDILKLNIKNFIFLYLEV